MEMKKATRRITAWIACFAVLLFALAPSITQAVNAVKGSGTGWLEICTATGFKTAKVDSGQNPASPAPAEKSAHFEHCPFCFTHSGAADLPPTAAITLPVVSNEQALPSLFYQSPRPLFTWSTAQSRAPPSLS
jgi:hypothetical protein